LNSTTRHYLIPAEPGRGRALAFAAIVHFLLLIFLWFGVSWQSDTPTKVEAEIWNPVAREAAPPPPPPIAESIQESPKPLAAVTPPTPPVAVIQPEPAQQKIAQPDIALEKEKKHKQEKEDAERLKKEKLAEKKSLEDEQKRKKIADAEEKQNEKKKQAELEKRADDKKQKEEAIAEEKKKLAEEQQRKQEESAATEQRSRKRREEIQRLNQLAGDGVAGDAEKSQGSRGDNSYARKVAGLIKSHTILPQNDIAGNPAVEFLIELQPDGGLRGEPKKTKSSGVAAFDLAVKRAIEKSAPFPPDPLTGKVPVNINITHRLKDSDTR
jgi:colicin import membrane protein